MKNAAINEKASMRLKDFELTVELLAEACVQEDGARERVATRHEIQKSVITDRVGRIERFFNVNLFTGPQRKTPSPAGRKMATFGPRLIDEISHFTGMLQDVSEPGTFP